MSTNPVSADALPLSRRLFTGRLAGAVAALTASPAITLAPEPAAAELAVRAAAPSAADRLEVLISELQALLKDEFPGYEFMHAGLPFRPGAYPSSGGFLIGAARLDPKPASIIEYDGPGIYEVAFKGCEGLRSQIRHLERVPRKHKLAGQFRFRFPDAPARSHWQYRPEADFQLIRRYEG